MKKILILVCAFAFCACSAPKWVATTHTIHIKNLRHDTEMEQMIALYKETVDREIVVIGKACSTLYVGKPESPLSNFGADALLNAANNRLRMEADFSIINVGEIGRAHV